VYGYPNRIACLGLLAICRETTWALTLEGEEQLSARLASREDLVGFLGTDTDRFLQDHYECQPISVARNTTNTLYTACILFSTLTMLPTLERRNCHLRMHVLTRHDDGQVDTRIRAKRLDGPMMRRIGIIDRTVLLTTRPFWRSSALEDGVQAERWGGEDIREVEDGGRVAVAYQAYIEGFGLCHGENVGDCNCGRLVRPCSSSLLI
jgi:hypothetical protein